MASKKGKPKLPGVRRAVTYAAAVKMLPTGDRIHTFRSGPFALIGADWNRPELLAAIKEFGCELSGPQARAAGHGLALIDRTGPLFIETKREKGEASR